jgi:KaiC/GvpD/RAD55 family RecA-like ATPase
MMMRIHSDITWMKEVFKEGFETGQSILISGPGGSGKPLVELGFVDAWLKAGGTVLGIPLQYPSLSMVEVSLENIYGTRLKDYPEQVAFIRFDPTIESEIIQEDHIWRANLIKDGVWEKVIDTAVASLPKSRIGTLVFGSALNLLLFNDRYRKTLRTTIKKTLRDSGSKTVIFTVSNNVYEDDVKIWEDSADNLMVTSLDTKKILRLNVIRMKSISYQKGETVIPIDALTLQEIEKTAKKTRTKNVQAIRSIT